MLIGYLNRRLGFKEFKPIQSGSPVFEQGGVYYVWQEHESGTYSEMVRYYPYSLASAIKLHLESVFGITLNE
jgi:hypothetical protein